MTKRITGDPFIDAGAMAAEEIHRHLGLAENSRGSWLKAVDWAAEKAMRRGVWIGPSGIRPDSGVKRGQI